MSFPLRHLSIRVPWHDNGWAGTICKEPKLNSACLCLKNIGAKKKEEEEEDVKGLSLEDVDERKYPPCVMDRATFMAPFAFTKQHTHPYSTTSPDTHGHFAPTTLRFPAFSAPGVPFRWFQRDLVWGKEDEKWPIRGLNKDFPLDGVLATREPELSFKTAWIQDAENHRALLNCFWNHIRTADTDGSSASLVFFYARQIPLTEEPARRIIVGVGRVLRLGPLTEYNYNEKKNSDSCRSLLWERMVSHSIKPGFTDGFLMPYHQALTRMEDDVDFDPSPLIAFAPADRNAEFAYATEHVTPDGALSSLLVVADALRNAQNLLKGDFSKQIAWIDEQVTRLWKQRGSCPGLGAVLGAMGIPLGSFVANEIVEQAGSENDPWPLVDKMLQAPDACLSPDLARRVDSVVGKGWKKRSETRKAFIRLLSRFDLTLDQATMLYSSENREQNGIEADDEAFVQNPYLIYEFTRLLPGAVAVSVLDRGIFPQDPIRSLVPVPEPSALKSGIDIRRLRALAVERLEFHAAGGHTLQPRKTIISEIRELPLDPKCDATSDTMEVAEDELFDDVINRLKLADKSDGYQLNRLAECGKFIRDLVQKRLKASPIGIEGDWAKLLDDALRDGGVTADDLTERDKLAREEKVAALQILANRRISVLIGPAGTGKTTLLSALVRQESIATGGVLLLAPTGKARVRMQEKIGGADRFSAMTIAQFLVRSDRFDGVAQRYLLTGEPGEKHAETVIIDECSMMTEEMLAATFEALFGVKRFILVGDHRQLPPIGPGKPFVDIVRYLEPDEFEQPFPKHHADTGYAELTVSMRQSEGEGGRDDIRLANWFTGTELPPGEDEILSLLIGKRKSPHLKVVEWNTTQELQQHMDSCLKTELGENGVLTQERFDQILGATLHEGYNYFNTGNSGKNAESWQILTPVRQHPWGVTELNRVVHTQWRKGFLELANRSRWRKICKPLGAEQIVYGDKVINNRNHFRWSWPSGERRALANGEIGMMVGPWNKKDEVNVEFSTQQGLNFTYKPKEFKDDGSIDLELAYALTVHRAQGSEFGVVFLILPRNRRMLSREMLYTALTRQRKTVVILCEGPAIDLVGLANDRFSETKTRLTNLFRPPNPKLLHHSYLDANLIHQTERGELVRSKSEVIIADHLNRKRIAYRYEEPLKLGDDIRIPDFTFDDDDTGVTYYWEHCGMMFNADYKRRWDEKNALYRRHGILPHEEGGGPKGTLIITQDDSVGGISSLAIGKLINGIL